MTDPSFVRRNFLALAGGASAAALLKSACAPLPPAAPRPPIAAKAPEAPAEPAPEPPPLTLNPTEYAFILAAVDTLIPADELSPSGSEAGVAVFIDRQLAGAYGAGARLYRQGPFAKGKPEHGYQLALTPRELFRAGIELTNELTREEFGKPFDALTEAERITVLQALEKGEAAFEGPPSQVFFEALLELSMQGFFADPIYGGNRDKVGWKLVGYPGLPATYASAMDEYRGKPFPVDPQSIADFS